MWIPCRYEFLQLPEGRTQNSMKSSSNYHKKMEGMMMEFKRELEETGRKKKENEERRKRKKEKKENVGRWLARVPVGHPWSDRGFD